MEALFRWLGGTGRRVFWTAVQAFLAVFLGGLLPVWEHVMDGDWTTAKSALLGLVVSAAAAALSVVKNAILKAGSEFR